LSIIDQIEIANALTSFSSGTNFVELDVSTILIAKVLYVECLPLLLSKYTTVLLSLLYLKAAPGCVAFSSDPGPENDVAVFKVNDVLLATTSTTPISYPVNVLDCTIFTTSLGEMADENDVPDPVIVVLLDEVITPTTEVDGGVKLNPYSYSRKLFSFKESLYRLLSVS
jgi:hypothetical protein